MTTVPVPICYSCLRMGDTLVCTAYPDGIPEAIVESQVDHRRPYDGDNGLLFEQDPLRPKPDFALLFGA